MKDNVDLRSAVRELWAADELLVHDSDRAQCFGLSHAMTGLLSFVGLPREVGGGGIFVATELEEISSSRGSRFVRIGIGWGEQSDICLEPMTGRILNPFTNGVEESDNGVYVNRGLSAFIEFLVAWERYARKVENGLTTTGAKAEASNVRSELTILDPLATIDSSWWCGILDELDMV